MPVPLRRVVIMVLAVEDPLVLAVEEIGEEVMQGWGTEALLGV